MLGSRPAAPPALLAAAFDAVPVGLVLYRIDDPGDPSTWVQILSNAGASAASGIDMRKDDGKTWGEVSPDLCSSEFVQLFRQALEGEEATWELDYGDEKFHRSGWHGSAKRIADGTLLVAFENVTKEQKLRRALEAKVESLELSNAELEQFVHVASHDLQEPLRMIASYTELLSHRYAGKIDEGADKYISYVVAGARRMQRLLNDLLSLSRVRTHGSEFEPFALDDALDDALEALGAAVRVSGARVRRSQLPEIVGDRAQLSAALQNLIGNAIKFRREDTPPRVEISCGRDGGAWRVSVTDEGIGVDPAYGNKVFQIFRRLNARRYEGSGIGLTIVERIVKRHGGRVWFEHAPGGGTTFHFTIAELESGSGTDAA